MNPGNEVRSSVVSEGEATSAADGLQGRPAGHLHRLQDGPPRRQSGPRGWRCPERRHRPGRRQAARRDAVQHNVASGLQPGLPEGPNEAPRAAGSTRLGAAVRPAVGTLPATENARVGAMSDRPETELGTGIPIGTEQDKGGRVTQLTARGAESTDPSPTAGPDQRKPTTSGAATGAGRGSNQRHE